MFPVLFHIGDFAVTSFGIAMFFSFVTGAWILGKQLKRYNLDPELAWDVLAWIAIGGVLGAKLYYLALNYQDALAHPIRELTSREGLVWYGGLIGGIAAYVLQIRAKKLPMLTMLDAAAPGLALAYGVGRLGCFLVGDDYGIYTDSAVGIAFPEGSPPSTAGYLRSVGDTGVPANLPDTAVVTVHPTQLYEVGLALVTFAFLWKLGGRKLKPGQLAAAWMIVYAIERFLVEFVRAKGDRIGWGITISQILSLILLVIGALIWVRQSSRPERIAEAPQPVRRARK